MVELTLERLVPETALMVFDQRQKQFLQQMH